MEKAEEKCPHDDCEPFHQNPEVENGDYNKERCLLNIDSLNEEPPPHTPPIKNGGGAVAKNSNEFYLEDSLEVRDPKGHKIVLSSTEIFQHFLSFGFTTAIIKQAIQIAKNEVNPITSPLRYLESICQRLSKYPEPKKFTKEKFDKNDGVPPRCTAKGITMEEFLKNKNKQQNNEL